MAEIWEATFASREMMWGEEPSRSALFARDRFAAHGVRDVLLPGAGYGRNAKPFLAAGMAVTGIEISETAIALARSRLGLDFPIHHGSVADMPFDERTFDGVFAYGLLYLLDAPTRARVLRACHAQLRPGGMMIFTVVTKAAPMFGQGKKLGEDWYEPHPGVPMFFYDAASIQREMGSYGDLEIVDVDEPHGGGSMPFHVVVCEAKRP